MVTHKVSMNQIEYLNSAKAEKAILLEKVEIRNNSLEFEIKTKN